MNSNNLRNEIEKVLTTYRSEATRDRTMLEMSNRDDDKIPTPIDEATDQILSLLEGSLPKEWDSEHQLGDYTTSQIDQIEKDAIGVIKYTEGWNACLQEIKEKLK